MNKNSFLYINII